MIFFLKLIFFSQQLLIENPRLEKEYMIKDVRNLFRLEKLKKRTIDTTIKGIRSLFRLEKENEEIKDRILRDVRSVLRLEKENKAIKDIILRNIRNLFENEEEENYKSVRKSFVFFLVKIILNIKVMMIEVKHYQLNNILIKLDHI